MKRGKRIFKAISWIFLFLFIIIIIYLAVPSYPYFFFREKLEYKNLTFYSDKTFPKEFKEVMKNTEFRIRRLEIYDSTFQPNIFICQSKDLYSIFAFWIGLNSNSQGFNLSLTDNTFINLFRVNTLNYYHDQRLKYTHLNGSLPQVIAHELVHNLDSKYTGFWNYREKPKWKKEGFAEYGSTIAYAEQDSVYDLFKRASLYFEDNLFDAPFHSKEYYKAQLMVEYLFSEKGFSLEMLNDTSSNENNVYDQLQKWYYEKKEYEKRILLN